MIIRRRFWLAFGALVMAAGAIAQEPGANVRDFLGLGPAPDAAAAKAGEPLYKENCAACHGQNARGSQGPNLIRSPLVLHDEKGEEISPVIKNGRPAAGMPAFHDLTNSETYDIAEFIHLQVELAANRGTYRQTYANLRSQASGDAAKGKSFFDAKCTGCHSATGDLSKIGDKYPQSAVMLTKIAWPADQGLGQATVITAGGVKFSGTLLKADDFDVILRDSDGALHSWPRKAVTLEKTDKLAAHRALLPEYTDEDLHNLTAYLVSLK